MAQAREHPVPACIRRATPSMMGPIDFGVAPTRVPEPLRRRHRCRGTAWEITGGPGGLGANASSTLAVTATFDANW